MDSLGDEALVIGGVEMKMVWGLGMKSRVRLELAVRVLGGE
jgi:hypothetical protein